MFPRRTCCQGLQNERLWNKRLQKASQQIVAPTRKRNKISNTTSTETVETHVSVSVNTFGILPIKQREKSEDPCISR